MKSFFSAHIILFLFYIETGSTVLAQQTYFTPILGNNGTMGMINSIVQDQQGYIWFANEDIGGIIRYDGTHMTSYKYDPKNPNSPGGSGPECMAADSSGNIWIGYWGTGLDRFEPESGKFTHFRHNPDDPASLCNDTLTSVLIDHAGNLWVGTHFGLDLYDQKTGHFIHYSHSEHDPFSLSCNKIIVIYEDHKKVIWIGTGKLYSNNNDGGLNRFDRSTGKFTRYMQNPDDPQSLVNNNVSAVFEDSRGTFWVGTAGNDGLLTMNREKGIFERHLYDPKKPDQLSRPPAKKDAKYNFITFIKEDKLGAIWIGTYSEGILQYDPYKNTVNHFNSSENKGSGFADDSGYCMFVAKDGVFWLSTEEKNLYRVDPFRNIIPNFKSSAINSFHVDPDSTLWYGTASEGLFRKGPGSTLVKQYIKVPGDMNSLSENNVSAIIRDDGGDLWVGSWGGGINRMNHSSEKFTHFRHDSENNKSLISDNVTSIYLDRELNLWIGTTSGCDVLEHNTDFFRHFLNNPKDTNSISRDFTTSFLEDSQNDFWVGTWQGGGVNRLNRRNGTFKHYLPDQSVNSLYADSQGIVWVGTESGIFQFNRKTDKFSLMDEKSIGFNVLNVTGIVEDQANNLWFGSSTGIVRLNPDRDRISIYGINEGVDGGSLREQVGYYSSNGYLYFATFHGYYSFRPEKLNFNPTPPSIGMNSFWIAGSLINTSTSGPLLQYLSKTSEIHLNYNQNVFSFGLAAIDFSNPEDAKIMYRLKNYDRDWIILGADGKASYYNVPPGKYTFEVKAFNSNNDIKTTREIKVSISPPFWKTWWAYLIYTLIFVSGVFGVDRFQRRRLIRSERERARERELIQAKEIEKAYTELKATQSQLIQAEKMASLGELTAGIAHEIQNPLNFVNNFSEVSNELIDEMNLELDKGDIAEARAIASDIKQNLEKINRHGKRADAIVKGMLQHSRTSSGAKEPTNINALVDGYLRLAYQGLRAKDKSFNATMKTYFDDDIGMINIVPQDIGRVILNLITNAFYEVNEKKKHLTKDQPDLENLTGLKGFEPTIWVGTKKTNGMVEVFVKDNGNGIPKSVLDKIFQPFFTTKPSGEGTGLGLSLSYDIVKAHGGEIKVETKEGEGSEFIIHLRDI